MKRFISLISNSTYNDTIFPNGMDIGSMELPSYQGMSKLYALILSDAILNLAHSNNQAGIELLSIARKRIDLQYNERSMPLLIDMMITNQQAQQDDSSIQNLEVTIPLARNCRRVWVNMPSHTVPDYLEYIPMCREENPFKK